ncbi:hypothetical protein V2J09_015571 [Rumex salicifolius]
MQLTRVTPSVTYNTTTSLQIQIFVTLQIAKVVFKENEFQVLPSSD